MVLQARVAGHALADLRPVKEVLPEVAEADAWSLGRPIATLEWGGLDAAMSRTRAKAEAGSSQVHCRGGGRISDVNMPHFYLL